MAVDYQPSMTIDMPRKDSTAEDTLQATLEELESELPVVYDGQVPLGELLSRVVQSIYAELSELAETMPNMSDAARKRTLADWVVKTKKQVVKLYAVAKWSRDAETVQKCMNITAFLLNQNHQFEQTIQGLTYAKESLDPSRARNHDLLTSLDVLTKGSYLRLPTCIKKIAIPQTPLTDEEVSRTLSDMEGIIRYRLRMTEIIPVEMSNYHIADGRVHFTAPKLFSTSVCLSGGRKDSGWFCVDVEFLISVGGDLTGLQEFPRKPQGILNRHIIDEADARLGFYVPLPEPIPEAPPRPELPTGVIDAPLVRLYNFLQMMSLSYQLEILWYQAERMRSLGWADYLTIQMSQDRKTLRVSYWIRPPPPPAPGRPRQKIPPIGGTLTIAITQVFGPPQAGRGPTRTSRQRVMARLQQKAKLGTKKPSDEVEGQRFVVKWEPSQGVLGMTTAPSMMTLPEGVLQVDADNVDFEHLLRVVIKKHTRTLLECYQYQLQHASGRVFSGPDIVKFSDNDDAQALQILLCSDEVVIVTIDARTGRLTLRDTGDLASASRAPRFSVISDRLNDNPTMLVEALYRLRINTIIDLAEQKANYLGLSNYRRRNIKAEDMSKAGLDANGATLFIQLSNFQDHYLVLVVAEERFRYALITTKTITTESYMTMSLEDIAWLDFSRIRGGSLRDAEHKPSSNTHDSISVDRKAKSSGFNLDTQGLRELYSYCCARVAFINVEMQLKIRGIPFTHINTTSKVIDSLDSPRTHSSLARSVPSLCVQSQDILSGAPAAEAAMPNIRVIPLNWWSNEKAQVVTCVKLKYVQQPMGKKANGRTVIRPSKRIIYDTTEAVVSFLSENVNTCVDEFLEEWARVSKMVVIAREVGKMARLPEWDGVRLLSFDLKTVEFVYAQDYTIAIRCEDQLSPGGGNFDLEFSRVRPNDTMDADDEREFNPHEDAEPFLRDLMKHAHGNLVPCLKSLVTLLRETLPIVTELEVIREDCEHNGRNVDIFAKAAGWYRLLYSDLRHALDFRLLTDQRVAIVDASHSLFDVQTSGKPTLTDSMDEDALGLQPIPHFGEIVATVVQEGHSSGMLSAGKVAAIGVGVVCNGEGVAVLTRAIHARVVEKLQESRKES
ncbi:MED14-domain-containing protein [Agrocybe pediades]|nr:MED14-domain-containing protein [Agrocybe pediades]